MVLSISLPPASCDDLTFLTPPRLASDGNIEQITSAPFPFFVFLLEWLFGLNCHARVYIRSSSTSGTPKSSRWNRAVSKVVIFCLGLITVGPGVIKRRLYAVLKRQPLPCRFWITRVMPEVSAFGIQ